jgi:hypothetical protein
MLPGIAAYCDPSFRRDLGSAVPRIITGEAMLKLNVKFVSAVFAGLLAGGPLAVMTPGVVDAADDCLSGPKGQTPQGGHWYYRIDHATKRHCWYLGDEREKLSQASPPISVLPEKPVPPKAEPPLQPEIANARAELAPQTRIEAPNSDAALPPTMPADAAPPQRWIVGARWPDPYNDPPAAEPAPPKRDEGTSANLTAQAQPTSVAPPEPIAAAEPSPAPSASAYSVPVRLAALLGALALAGITGGIVFRLTSTPRHAHPRIRKPRGAIWEQTDDDRILLSARPSADALSRRTGFARDLDQPGDRSERIAEFFAQISRRSPT